MLLKQVISFIKNIENFKIAVIILKKFMNIGKTSKYNLREDETVVEVVKKYKCLYDKSYKESSRIERKFPDRKRPV